jgi:hypothetical protein
MRRAGGVQCACLLTRPLATAVRGWLGLVWESRTGSICGGSSVWSGILATYPRSHARHSQSDTAVRRIRLPGMQALGAPHRVASNLHQRYTTTLLLPRSQTCRPTRSPGAEESRSSRSRLRTSATACTDPRSPAAGAHSRPRSLGGNADLLRPARLRTGSAVVPCKVQSRFPSVRRRGVREGPSSCRGAQPDG